MKVFWSRGATLFIQAVLISAWYQPAFALDLPPVVVTATRLPERSYDLPIAIDAVGASDIQDENLRVNASEALIRVPGVVAHNRQNYAQDLQVSSRGFGSRSTFGVRGVRILADGMPLTMPDGQGQLSSFDLGSAERIEVLRGPFSTLYGNAAGGVIQIFTEDGPPNPTLESTLEIGSYGTQRQALKFEGQEGNLNYVLDSARFATEGYRGHSDAVRNDLNGKFRFDLSPRAKLTIILTGLQQPQTQDPLGLTRAQADSEPRQAPSVADQFNTRKTIGHEQGGAIYEMQMGEGDQIRVMSYGGHRAILQFLAIPVASQAPATSPGGVVDLDRGFGGLDARWTHNMSLFSAPLSLTIGGSYDDMVDMRKGFQNFIGSQTGVEGALRRDERDVAEAWGEFLQAEWEPLARWRLLFGLRDTQINFYSHDYYIVPGSGGTGGSAHFSSVSPVGGVLYEVNDALHLYANAGLGFETPTFDELAYRPDGTNGLNFALQPSHSNNYEVGSKIALADKVRAAFSLFQIDTRDEIVVNSNTGGRSTYQNAGRTEREGAELLVDASLGAGFGAHASYSLLDAWFKESFAECVGTPCTPVTVLPGSKLPAVPRSQLFSEISWKHSPTGFSTAIEAVHADKLYVNDANMASADSYNILNWRMQLTKKFGNFNGTTFFRLDNLTDKAYVGSVIVAETSSRFYEPAPGRNYLAGVQGSWSF